MSLKRSSVIHQVYVLKNILEMLLLALYIPLNLIFCFEVYTAKNQYRKLETNIPRKGIARPQSQFPHSFVCERFIYSHDGSAYSAALNIWTNPGNI
jgi:hypothetical protein